MKKELPIKCEDCKKEIAKIKFSSDPLMSLTHGWGMINLCRACYIKRIKKQIKICQDNLNYQLKLLKKEICHSKLR